MKIQQLLLPVVLGLLIHGCERHAQPVRDSDPVLLIAVDGLEWRLLHQFASEGLLPNLSRLMREGSFGQLQTLVPTHSPAIWTTVATGRLPAEHGILTFSYEVDGEAHLYLSGHRRNKALWNIATERGLSVDCIGWWCTFPVEAVSGVMVAQTNTTSQIDVGGGRNVWKGNILEDVPEQVFPPEREREMLAIAREVHQTLDATIMQSFGEPTHPQSELCRRLVNNTRWALAADETYRRIANKLLAEGPAALTMVYFGGIDVVSHRFLRYLFPNEYEHPPTRQELEDYGHYVAAAYQWVDDAIGQLSQHLPGGNVIVLSDHGFHPVNTKAKFNPEDPPEDVNSGGHHTGPAGVFIASGPDIAASGTPAGGNRVRIPAEVGGVCDVFPTVLRLLDLPEPRDLMGTVMKPVLATPDEDPVAVIDSYESEQWRSKLPQRILRSRRAELLLAEDADKLEALRQLGYLDEQGLPLLEQPAPDSD